MKAAEQTQEKIEPLPARFLQISIITRFSTYRFLFVSITWVFHKLQNIQKQRNWKRFFECFRAKIQDFNKHKIDYLSSH